MKTTNKIKTQIKSFLEGRIKPEQFGVTFPDLVFDYEDELLNGDKALFLALDDLRMACALFDHYNPEGDKNYTSLVELKAMAVDVYQMLVRASSEKRAA